MLELLKSYMLLLNYEVFQKNLQFMINRPAALRLAPSELVATQT